MMVRFLILFFSIVTTAQNYSASTQIDTTNPSKIMRNIIEILSTYNEKNIPEAQEKIRTIRNLLNHLNKKQEKIFLSSLVYLHQCTKDCHHLSRAECEEIFFKDLKTFERYTWKIKFLDNKEMEYVRSHNLVNSTLKKRYFLLAKLFIEKGFGYVTPSMLQSLSLAYNKRLYSIEKLKHAHAILRVFDGIHYKGQIIDTAEEHGLLNAYFESFTLGNYTPLRQLLLLEPWVIASATGNTFAIQEMANAMERIFKPDCIKPILQFLVHTAPEEDKLLLQKVQIEYERYLNLDRPPLWDSRIQEIDGIIRPGTITQPYQKTIDLQSKYQDTMPEDIIFETLHTQPKYSFVQRLRSMTTQDDTITTQPKVKNSFTQKIKSIAGQSDKQTLA